MKRCDPLCASISGQLWRRHEVNRGPDPPTYVQTPPEISANPLKSDLYRRGCTLQCMNIVTFTAHQVRKKFRTPTFLGWRRHWPDVNRHEILIMSPIVILV